MEGGLEQSQKGWDLKVTMTAGLWSIALWVQNIGFLRILKVDLLFKVWLMITIFWRFTEKPECQLLYLQWVIQLSRDHHPQGWDIGHCSECQRHLGHLDLGLLRLSIEPESREVDLDGWKRCDHLTQKAREI